ncbi:MAG: M20 metallopeptidase family protein [Christensenellales bacterium]|jgi:amidohydrolase
MTDNEVLRLATENEAWMTQVRRALHRIPERGFAEYKTQKAITEILDALGIPYTTERTWIIGLIEGAEGGKTVALRADMDALPLTESNNAPFCSEHEGMMHACGHDMHMAMVLAAAKILSENRHRFRGKVKLLFQPAEETDGGAKPMVQAGALENPHVDFAYGLHVQPRLPLGVIECRAGAFCASTDEIVVRVVGKGGHGAYPESGRDAIVAACGIVTGLQAIVSRAVAPVLPAVVHFGIIRGGSASNILAETVELRGTVRAGDPETRALLHREVIHRAQALAQAYGCNADVQILEGYAPLVNHPEQAQLVANVAARLFGRESVRDKDVPSMGGEDFSYFIEHTPGAFYNLGCGADPASAFPLHSPNFSPDERCMRYGLMMHLALANEHLRMDD